MWQAGKIAGLRCNSHATHCRRIALGSACASKFDRNAWVMCFGRGVFYVVRFRSYGVGAIARGEARMQEGCSSTAGLPSPVLPRPDCGMMPNMRGN